MHFLFPAAGTPTSGSTSDAFFLEESPFSTLIRPFFFILVRLQVSPYKASFAVDPASSNGELTLFEFDPIIRAFYHTFSKSISLSSPLLWSGPAA